ncbi:S-layer homology domain-containing protein [Bacillus piscicola]|uniref:S-layer homology domain-containing protein n=1 Tax=Bacillus piscicola TaxID=1632684 RepID=UPI001F08ECD8|nr:S-layer homology domain-containing protein [Bacillus piscicola]
MAYQPKSYRKFLATSVSAAVVATAFSAVGPMSVQQADAAESFSDVDNTFWASENIQRLADQGIINGYKDGTYRPNQEINRGQVAELLVNAFDLEVDPNVAPPFEDLSEESYYTPFAAAVKEAGLIQGRENNTQFAPGMDLSREQMATILVRAFDLEPIKGEEADVSDLEEAHESHQDNIEVLAQYNITSTADGKFRPKETVTRAQFAAFLDRALEIAEPTDISEVNALTDDGHVLEVKFTAPYRESLNRVDVRVFETASGARKGVESVELAPDGMSAEVHLYDNTSDDAKDEVPRLVKHTIQIGDLEYNFTRPEFIKHRVVSIDPQDGDFTILTDNGNTETIEVPEEFEDFDYQALLGEEVSVWFDEDNVLEDYSIEKATADYDAIEITKEDEVKLLTEDEKFDTSDEQFDDVDQDQFRFYVNGEEADISEYVDRKFNFAKVGYDRSGDVVYVSAYNLTNFLVVDRVENNEVIGHEGEGTGGAFDAKDATIVKDGKVISLDDLEENDVLFFNPDANGDDGFAEVYNNEVQGEIDTVYNESIKVNGEVYDFTYDSGDIENFHVDYEGGAVYLNEDGETEFIDSDAAEKLQAAGEVVLHLDRAGNLVYIDGDLADVESNTKPAVLTEDVKFDSNFGKDLAQIEAVTSDDEEKLYEVQLANLNTITVNGVEYDIDDANDRDADEWKPTVDGDNIVLVSGTGGDDDVTIDADYLAEGQLVQLHLDDDGDLKELEFFTANDTDEGTDTLKDEEVLEAGDTYFNAESGAKRLNNDTVVFDATKGYSASDIKVTTWDDYNGSAINDATVIYDDEDEAIAIVIDETTTTDVVYEEAVITKVLRNTDEEVVEITAYVNGEKQTFEVNDVDVNLTKGNVAVLKFDDNNTDLVEDILVNGDNQYDDRIVVGDVDEVNVGKKQVTIDGTVYTLVSDGAVVDVTDTSDISDEALRDLRGEKDVTVVLDETSGKFAKFFVMGADVEESTVAEDLTDAITDAEAAIDEAVVGDGVGEYSQEAVDAYQEAIDAAQAVLDNEDATNAELEDALEELAEATTAFEEAANEPGEDPTIFDVTATALAPNSIAESIGIYDYNVEGSVANIDNGETLTITYSGAEGEEDESFDTTVDADGNFVSTEAPEYLHDSVTVTYTDEDGNEVVSDSVEVNYGLADQE